jgi:hypothetical protein
MGLLHVATGVVHETEDVMVVEGVKRLPPCAPHSDQTRGTQQTQLM